MEKVQAGDKCDFTGTLIVVPDVAQLRSEGREQRALPAGYLLLQAVHGWRQPPESRLAMATTLKV